MPSRARQRLHWKAIARAGLILLDRAAFRRFAPQGGGTVMRWYRAIISLLLLSSTLAAQTTELTFRCNGKSKDDNTEEPITNMSVVVNLTKKTVTGLAIVANIYKVDDAGIFFEGTESDPIDSNSPIQTIFMGNINRITSAISGELKVIWGTQTYTTTVHLICTPTRRLS
jgi:hypothetical protein